MPLLPQIQLIRAYTQQHPELLAAHHFVYDLPVDRSLMTARFVVMGINPGEQDGDWDAAPYPTEETSDYDFRQETDFRPRGAQNWLKSIEFFCGTREVVMSEFFFWSSKNVGKAFHDRFGVQIERSPHLMFCAERNNTLVSHYSARAVVAPGLRYAELFAEVYGLRYVDTLWSGSTRLVEHFDRGSTPWLFTKHWSGSYGFSTSQRQLVRTYIATVTSNT